MNSKQFTYLGQDFIMINTEINTWCAGCHFVDKRTNNVYCKDAEKLDSMGFDCINPESIFVLKNNKNDK